MNNTLPAQVYKINREKDGNHFLTVKHDMFVVPNKNYGDLDENVDIIWNDYLKSLSGTGVMLTGSPGTGKSLLGEVLANHAISMGVPVVYCSEIKTDIQTVNYLAMLKNCVIFLDEFGKNFDHRLQDKMLSMLASVSSGKKLFIITESVIGRINSDILNRTKRIKYHLDYDRVEKDILIEYCNDKGVKNDFFVELYAKYETSPVFSFDNLEGIVEEHLSRPEASLDKLLKVLNLSALTRPLHVNIKGVKDLKTDQSLNFTFNDAEVKLREFRTGRRIWVDIHLPEEKPAEGAPAPQNHMFGNGGGPRENVMITNDMISRVDGNLFTIKYAEKYEIYLEGR